ncbi:MAG: DUF309 domain-containing protein [Leptolyngbya foveolarum]|uniref:DUF309 domain-containing protein n=1 Tax=Leptolyngbya foveolarum TaxID=47253 RepID=A0A2W4WR56_9CYAN|nr:MAG: DUF309 domain-containing protein [Leptolyngbya foveolarum]
MPTLSSDRNFADEEPSKSSSPEDAIEGTSDAAEVASLARGIAEFNTEQFYSCHDTLEAVWMDAEYAEKPFYQGILQIAVAFYHLGNLNWRGGAILLGEGLGRLLKFEPSHEGVDVEALVDEAVEWLALVQAAGPEGVAAMMAELPRSLPKIQPAMPSNEATV